MPDSFLRYLTREHDRLDRELSGARNVTGELHVARLTKLKAMVQDQINERERIPQIIELA